MIGDVYVVNYKNYYLCQIMELKALPSPRAKLSCQNQGQDYDIWQMS